MGTYKGLQGYRVESLASDPGTISEVIGKVWYNSGSNVWKVGVEGPGAWAAAPTLNEARSSAGYSGTSNTSALIFGGNTDYPFALPGETEQYNGTSWTQVNAQQAARMNTGSNGTSTSALCWGGQTFTGGVPGLTPSVKNEEWNGTSWAEKANIGANRNTCAGAGGPAAPTAALCIGGGPEPVGRTCVLWNGTSWTEVANIAVRATTTGGCSVSGTATMKIGGYSGPPEIYYNYTEEWADPVIGAKTITTS